jgi:hypothetical protein
MNKFFRILFLGLFEEKNEDHKSFLITDRLRRKLWLELWSWVLLLGGDCDWNCDLEFFLLGGDCDWNCDLEFFLLGGVGVVSCLYNPFCMYSLFAGTNALGMICSNQSSQYYWETRPECHRCFSYMVIILFVFAFAFAFFKR